nr:uncharacterized protein LOC109422554 [Aedes albopictus]
MFALRLAITPKGVINLAERFCTTGDERTRPNEFLVCLVSLPRPVGPLLRDGATACKASGLHNYTSLAKPRARNLNTTSFSSLDCNESHGHTVPKTAIVIFGNQKTWLVNRHDLRRPKSWDRKCRPIIHIEKCWIQIPKRQHAVEDSDESATVRGSSIGHTTEIEDERTSQVATCPDTCRGKSTLDQRKLHKGSQSEEKRRSEDSRKNPGTNNTPADAPAQEDRSSANS